MPWQPPSGPIWQMLVEEGGKYAMLDRVLREELDAGETREIVWRLYREDGYPYGQSLSGVVDWFMLNTLDPDADYRRLRRIDGRR